jgi:hypothetical protein
VKIGLDTQVDSELQLVVLEDRTFDLAREVYSHLDLQVDTQESQSAQAQRAKERLFPIGTFGLEVDKEQRFYDRPQVN